MRWLLLSLLLVIWSSALSGKEGTSVHFIVPANTDSPFWSMVSEVSQAAADDLNLELDVVYTTVDRFALHEAITTAIARDNQPDFLIFFPHLGNTQATFQALDEAEQSFITIEQSFPADLAQKLGEPQGKYSHWLGHIRYDNREAGRQLLNALLRAYKQENPDTQALITGIGGDRNGTAMERQAILEQGVVGVDKRNASTLPGDWRVNQIFNLYWNPDMVTERMPRIEARYPDADIYWCASDEMALAVIDYYRNHNLAPVKVGGFDWIGPMLESIESGSATASMGGQFLMVADALLKIYDYENGINRFVRGGMNSFELVTKDNVQAYRQFMRNKAWNDVDFVRFSEAHSGAQAQPLTVINMIEASPVVYRH